MNAALDTVGDLLNGEYEEDPQDSRKELEENSRGRVSGGCV